MAIRDEIKEQTIKLKDMDNKHRLEYVWHYYKWWFIAAIVAVIAITALIKTVIFNNKPIYLNAVFLNSDISMQGENDQMAIDFGNALLVDAREYRIVFDYSSFVTNDFSDQVAYANKIKLLSRYTTEEIDVCIGPDLVMTDAADFGEYLNFEEALPAELINRIQNKGYEPFYYTEKIYDDYSDKNGEPSYTEGETYLAGFYVDNCPKLIDEYGVYSRETANTKENGRLVLTIAPNTPNLAHAIEFVEYIID